MARMFKVDDPRMADTMKLLFGRIPDVFDQVASAPDDRLLAQMMHVMGFIAIASVNHDIPAHKLGASLIDLASLSLAWVAARMNTNMGDEDVESDIPPEHPE